MTHYRHRNFKPGIMYFRAQLQRMRNSTKSTAGTASIFSMELT